MEQKYRQFGRENHIMQNNTKLVNLLFISVFSLLLVGCSSEKTVKNAAYTASKTVHPQLTDKDIFDEELDKEITDYDIQEAAYQARNGFYVPVNSSIILVKSGATVPDAYMQSELAKFYRISTYNGFANTKRPSNRKKSKDTENAFNNNYMRQLRLIAAKGGQSTIIVYWGTVEKAVLNEKTNLFDWSPYDGTKLQTDTKLLRYLLRFTLVDVITGNWSTYSPVNLEVKYIDKKMNSNMTDALQIDRLIRQTDDNAILLLVDKYKKR